MTAKAFLTLLAHDIWVGLLSPFLYIKENIFLTNLVLNQYLITVTACLDFRLVLPNSPTFLSDLKKWSVVYAPLGCVVSVSVKTRLTNGQSSFKQRINRWKQGMLPKYLLSIKGRSCNQTQLYTKTWERKPPFMKSNKER